MKQREKNVMATVSVGQLAASLLGGLARHSIRAFKAIPHGVKRMPLLPHVGVGSAFLLKDHSTSSRLKTGL